jgi:hypothetical protein
MKGRHEFVYEFGEIVFMGYGNIDEEEEKFGSAEKKMHRDFALCVFFFLRVLFLRRRRYGAAEKTMRCGGEGERVILFLRVFFLRVMSVLL